jgi:hypothetical protein
MLFKLYFEVVLTLIIAPEYHQLYQELECKEDFCCEIIVVVQIVLPLFKMVLHPEYYEAEGLREDQNDVQ